MHAALTSYLDVAQLTLYGFWLFFAGLIFYLRSEDKREGYPLSSERSAHIKVQGFPPIPSPKTFKLRHGGTRLAPRPDEEMSGSGNASPSGLWPGAPLVPNGDPMLDGVGPAAYAQRPDTPDLSMEGHNRIVPLRADSNFYLEPDETDPRGMAVIGHDGVIAGVVSDMWIDRAETVIRYLEVEVPSSGGARHVLLPVPLARISARGDQVNVKAVLARHFATAPVTGSPDEVTLLEEDRIQAYFASGHLYATAARSEPLL
jgi:photosynthetic reaction center H subunit